MGGATALRFSEANSPVPIACMVVDSAFCRFKEVAEGMVAKIMPGMPPEALMQMLWPQVCAAVNQETGGLDLNTLNPIESAAQRTVPGLFLHAIDDELIPMSHTERNFDSYAGAVKDVSYFEGNHNSQRPDDTLGNAFTFLRTHMLTQ
mmetsp:Transcript_11639/g.15780  ORF Transcript_11639/g.15780 Transcript_11639/m.15780 type:complete len:148 (-) Transcript_11639:96-539(-)